MMKIKIFSDNNVRQVVTMAQAIAAVKEAYIQLSMGKVVMPQRLPVPIQEGEGEMLFMPAYLISQKAFGAKIVSVFPRNKERDLPTICAVVIIFDVETGRPLAIMDGTLLTALRTGAASGVATELLGRNDARVLAIIGAGAQAFAQLEAVCKVRSIEKVWVYDCAIKLARLSVKKMKALRDPVPSDIFVAESPAQAVREADIICTATTSLKPVFDDEDLKEGVHINGIGSYRPDMQEIPSQTVIRSKIVVDSLTACLAEAGDLIIPLKQGLIAKEQIHGEIGKIAAGQLPGRESNSELTFFKSVGLAVQDVALAELVLRNDKKLGLSTNVEL
jgi:alanine dehydrogenase